MPLAKQGDLVLDYVEGSDAEGVARLFVRSWHVYPFFQHMMPDNQQTIDAWVDTTKFTAKDPNTICLKVTDENTGRIVAHGRWIRPKRNGESTQPGHEEGRWSNVFLQACDEKLAGDLFGFFEESREKLMGQEPHWYMELLFTDPEYGRKGCGSMILQHGLELADRDGLPSYIDASPMGAPLYRKFGWGLDNRKELDYGLVYIAGVRKPHGK